MADMHSEEALTELVKLVLHEVLKKHRTIKFIGEVSLATKKRIMVVTETSESIVSPDILCLGQLPVGMMGRLVQFAPKDQAEEEVIDHLLAAKQVLVCESGVVALAKNSGRPLHAKLNVIYQEFLAMGVEEVGTILKKSKQRKRVLYTEDKIKQLETEQDAEVYVEEGAIFTALAKDYIREKQLHVVRTDRGGSSWSLE